MSTTAANPDQLVLDLGTADLTADMDERRERHISASRHTRAKRRAEHLRAVQGAARCRCPRPLLNGSRCFACGRELPHGNPEEAADDTGTTPGDARARRYGGA
jgi:hypothetical protein